MSTIRMRIIEAKAGTGIRSPYNEEGLFDFGKILLKTALSSNLVKTASRAINSELVQTAIRAVKGSRTFRRLDSSATTISGGLHPETPQKHTFCRRDVPSPKRHRRDGPFPKIPPTDAYRCLPMPTRCL